MSDFRSSSQRDRWIFQPHDLVERWTAANQRAATYLAQYGTTRVKLDEHGSANPPDRVEGSSDIQPLSYEEEKLTRVFYEQKIQEVCLAFKFPHKIQATAIIYFKRFFLQWSVMEHHPKHIMLTCVYTSCKVEENHVSAEELGKGIKQDHQIILDNEVFLLKTLGFDLIVYAPYRSIEGFIDDLEGFFREGNGALQRLKELHQTAISYTDKVMLTDAPLIYTPGQLALAALHKSNDILGVFNFERYLETIFSRQHSDCTVEEFVQSLNAIHYLVDQLNIPTNKDMRYIDRKLKHCWDPSSHDEHKKKEKKSKHKSKRTSTDAQLVSK